MRRQSYPFCATAWLAVACVLALFQSHSALAISRSVPLAELAHDQWTPRDGLPSTIVSDLLVSRTGHLWLAMENGLSRFDGARFVSVNRRTHPGLPADNSFGLVETGDGVIWVATHKGIAVRRGSRFETVSLDVTEPGRSGFWVITSDERGGLWAADETRLHHISNANAQSVSQRLPAGMLVRSLLSDGQGGVWCAGKGGLYRFFSGEWLLVVEGERLGGVVFAMLRESDGTLLVGANGVHVFPSIGTGAISADNTRLLPGSAGMHITKLLRDRHGTLWVGTRAGLFREDDAGLSLWQSGATKAGGQRFEVYSLAEDAEGSLWVGTSDSGLHRLRHGAAHTLGQARGLSSRSVYSVLHANDGTVWIAGDGGLDRLHGGQLLHVDMKTTGRGWARALLEDSRGRLWVGAMDGIHCLEPGGSWRVYPVSPNRNMGGVRTFAESHDGRIWAGSMAGLMVLEGGAFVPVQAASGAPGGILAMARGTGKELWAGGLAGVGRLEDGVFKPLPNTEPCVGLSVASDGTVWAGQIDGGFLRITNGRVHQFGMMQGLPVQTVMGLAEDAAGNLWLTTNEGVLRLRVSEVDEVAKGLRSRFSVASYGFAEGMVERECNGGGAPLIEIAEDGRVWVPTIAGVVVIQPPKATERLPAPGIQIDELIADGVSHPLSAALELPAGTREVVLRYSGVSLSAAATLHYRLVLQGSGQQEIDAGVDLSARYLGLSPGKYVFSVKALRDDGTASERPAELPFTIAPHFWETWTFRGAVLLVLGVLVVVADRLRHRAARLREQDLRKRVEEEMAKVKVLTGLLPVCAWCSRIRDDKAGSWQKMEQYLAQRTDASFTHGMCPDCLRKFSEENGLPTLDLKDD